MSQIAVVVSPEGETRITTTGFSGPACREATRALEAALGLVAHEQLTSEFYTDARESLPAPAAEGR
jgi:hypothetical protein